jgi:hypothetical protein
VRDLKRQGLDLPTRVVTKEDSGALVWKAPTLSAVVRLLTNPAYAGAYVYGRAHYTREQCSPKTGKALARQRALAEWPVLLPDHHPGYLPWEEFVRNREQLRANWGQSGGPGVAREGAALLQGLVACDRCGQPMRVQHHASRERRSPSYVCARGYQEGAAHVCQSMTARPVDALVVQAFLEAVSPLRLAVALQVQDRIEEDLVALRRQQELQLEQARYEARRAQRQYDACDPDNRLVAAELERRWNEHLGRVTQLERVAAQAEQDARWTMTTTERAAINTLAQDLPALWQAHTTTDRDRKQLLRSVIAAVSLDGMSQPGQIVVQIHWHSGTITTADVPRPLPGAGSLKTPEGALALIRAFAATHPYEAIAAQVTAAGWQTAFGRPFTSQHVGYLCRRYGWARGHPHAPDPARGGAGAAILD